MLLPSTYIKPVSVSIRRFWPAFFAFYYSESFTSVIGSSLLVAFAFSFFFSESSDDMGGLAALGANCDGGGPKSGDVLVFSPELERLFWVFGGATLPSFCW